MIYKRTDRTMDAYLMEFDVSREKPAARVVIGSGFPDEHVPIPCMQDAAPSKIGKSPEMAGTRTTLASPEVGSRIRRLFGRRRDAARQDV